MPLPTKQKDESQKEFMSRCMGDDVMNTEFKDGKQRAAVCISQYQQHKKSKGSTTWNDVRQGDILGII
jgi:hypothetical protein